MNDLVEFGLFVGGIWALSLLGLKSIHDTPEAEKRLKDASALAIVAVTLVGAVAGAFALGLSRFETIGSGLLASFIFLIPFVAMAVVYFHKKNRAGIWVLGVWIALFILLSVGLTFSWAGLNENVVKEEMDTQVQPQP